MTSLYISNKRRIAEIAAVLLTAAGKFVFMDYLEWQLPFIAAAILSWTGYISHRTRTAPGITRYWGFRMDNFTTVLLRVLPFGIFAVVACVGTGFYQGTILFTWHIIPILILYPIWGIIQQFLLIALTAGNMQDLKGQKLNKGTIILISAFLFAIVHFPIAWLIAGTFVLALFYGWIYMGERNIYVLGLFHGWIGGIFYYTVVNRDPFVVIFGRFFDLRE